LSLVFRYLCIFKISHNIHRCAFVRTMHTSKNHAKSMIKCALQKYENRYNFLFNDAATTTCLSLYKIHLFICTMFHRYTFNIMQIYGSLEYFEMHKYLTLNSRSHPCMCNFIFVPSHHNLHCDFVFILFSPV
jgi:hypothetical protein